MSDKLPRLQTLAQEIRLNAVMPLVIDYISDCFIALDDDGHVLFANRSMLHAIGYTLKDLKYQPFIDFLKESDIERTLKAFEESKIKGVLGEFTNEYKCKDGSYIKLKWRQSFNLQGISFGISEAV